jgi:hypothetical protein
MLIKGEVGLKNAGNGSSAAASQGNQGELLVSELLPRYSQLVLAGKVFRTVSNAVTVTATTDISPLPANTGRPILSVGNPLSSNKVFVMLASGVATISGTPGGPILWNSLANVSSITAATNATAINALVGGPTNSASKIWNATAITGSSAGVLRGVAASIAAVAATGNSGNAWAGDNDMNGIDIITPGNGLLMAAYATGTTHIISAWAVWAELDAAFITG